MRANWSAIFLIGLIVAALVGPGVWLVRSYRVPPPPPVIAVMQPASQPTTQATPTTQLADYPALIEYQFKSLAATQPSVVALPPSEAAHLVLTEPVYCDSAGELWITHPLAAPTEQVLRDAKNHTTHLVPETVRYVHRVQDETGYWQPQLIVESDSHEFTWVTCGGRSKLPGGEKLDWSRATTADGTIFVPGDGGVSQLVAADKPANHFDFEPGKAGPVQIQPLFRGALAWQSCENPDQTGHGAVRFVGGQWKKLDGWPENIVHLIPLLDGGVLTIALDADKNASITTHPLDVTPIDSARVTLLIDQLSDPEADARSKAYDELQRWGAGAWAALEKAQADQPPEAQVRIGQLLAARDHPELLGYQLIPGPMRLIARNGSDVMLQATAGVNYQREGDPKQITVAPAYLMLDEHGVQLAPPALAAAIDAGGAVSCVNGEWFVSTPIDGPRWWVSNHLTQPLLQKRELAYAIAGIDARGRWLFRKTGDGAQSLIIDPTLPDTRPRLPIWVYSLQNGTTGWTSDDWPAMKSGGTWMLAGNEWKTVTNGSDYLTENAPPVTQPATTSTSGPSEEPLATDASGNRYFKTGDGLRIVRKEGPSSDWPLPEIARSESPTQYFSVAGYLFLYNEPGRILRISLNDGVPKVDASFTHNLPMGNIRRVWVDPAGRIDFAFDQGGLAVSFPTGRIPREFAEKMTAESLKQAEEVDEDPAP